MTSICPICDMPCRGRCLGRAILWKDKMTAQPHPGVVFVFGSNTAGRHGAGSANWAWKVHAARYGVGEGHTGRAYAIPTKDDNLVPRSLEQIEASVDKFVAYSIAHPELEFFVVKIGCGLAGFREEQIAPMFLLVGNNVMLPAGWDDLRWYCTTAQ